MARNLSPVAHHQTSTVRQLKLLVLLLILSNLGLGGLSFYLLRKTDRTYSGLIDQSVPVLNDLQALTANAVEAMRGTNGSLFGETAEKRTAAAQRARRDVAEDLELRTKLLRAPWMGNGRVAQAELQSLGDRFSDSARELIGLLEAGRMAEATRYREDIVRGLFERYIVVITKSADLVQDESLRLSGTLTDNTDHMSNLVLGIASWPVLLLGGLLVLTAGFVVVLMILFRGREMNDVP